MRGMCCLTPRRFTRLLTASRNKYAKSLGFDEIEFFEYDHMSPPDPPLPYIVSSNGAILRYRVNKPKGPRACFPQDVSDNFIRVIIPLI